MPVFETLKSIAEHFPHRPRQVVFLKTKTKKLDLSIYVIMLQTVILKLH